MTSKLTVACLQVNSGPVVEDNMARIAPMIETAHARGAKLVTLPESCGSIIGDRAQRLANAYTEDAHPCIPLFSRSARDYGLWILAGSLAVKTGRDKLANRSYMFAPDGTIAARYDKIHMFDADLGEGETYRESDRFHAGDKAVLVETPFGKIGLTICYDVRFGHLHRALAKAGASIITAPAAFAATTGKLHWHVLLRARAIETGCFIIAPAQCGTHDSGRSTYGHSLVIAPSGEIIAEAGESPDIITAEIDLAQVASARRMLPCLQHDRDFELL